MTIAQTMRDKTLAVLIEGRHAGQLIEGTAGRLSFTYTSSWLAGSGAPTPLSLSMPPADLVYGDRVVRPFLTGLLPDNPAVVARWARAHGVSARNPFALLRHVGEDCAGAVQIVRPDRIDTIVHGHGSVEWLDDAEIGRQLRDLRGDPTSWQAATGGQFSLAGAQAKKALHRDASGRWGVPSGAVPTTHILKPAVTGLDEHDLNEHLCLAAARLLGLPAARTNVSVFDGERAIVVERYDRRALADGALVRIHQEDLCQALSEPPDAKYENDGGPGAPRITDLLRSAIRPTDAAERAVAMFVDGLVLNWLLAGTDAHAKNYSLLLAGPEVRLAPLYDVASALPYGDHLPKLKLAMRVGGEYRLGVIEGRHWRRLADEVGLDAGDLVDRIADLAHRVPEAMEQAASDPAVDELNSPLPARLVKAVAGRAADCLRRVGQRS